MTWRGLESLRSCACSPVRRTGSLFAAGAENNQPRRHSPLNARLLSLALKENALGLRSGSLAIISETA